MEDSVDKEERVKMTQTDTMGAKPEDAFIPPMRGKSARLKGFLLGCGHANKKKQSPDLCAKFLPLPAFLSQPFNLQLCSCV